MIRDDGKGEGKVLAIASVPGRHMVRVIANIFTAMQPTSPFHCVFLGRVNDRLLSTRVQGTRLYKIDNVKLVPAGAQAQVKPEKAGYSWNSTI